MAAFTSTPADGVTLSDSLASALTSRVTDAGVTITGNPNAIKVAPPGLSRTRADSLDLHDSLAVRLTARLTDAGVSITDPAMGRAFRESMLDLERATDAAARSGQTRPLVRAGSSSVVALRAGAAPVVRVYAGTVLVGSA